MIEFVTWTTPGSFPPCLLIRINKKAANIRRFQKHSPELVDPADFS